MRDVRDERRSELLAGAGRPSLLIPAPLLTLAEATLEDLFGRSIVPLLTPTEARDSVVEFLVGKQLLPPAKPGMDVSAPSETGLTLLEAVMRLLGPRGMVSLMH
jgi:hypothetical protein